MATPKKNGKKTPPQPQKLPSKKLEEAVNAPPPEAPAIVIPAAIPPGPVAHLINMNLGIGRNNAVEYPYILPKRAIGVRRYLADVTVPHPLGGLGYSPANPRLVTKLARQNLPATQENLKGLLVEESKELVESLPITGGVNSPIVINSGRLTEEGNRRLNAYRILYESGNQAFQYIPVEELPPDITPGEIRVLLAIRHVKSEKAWQPREQWRVIETMLADKELTKGQIATILEVSELGIDNAILAKNWYDEQDAYSTKQPQSSQTKDQDRLFTYFWKLSTKKKFRDVHFAEPSERERFYKYVHNGQFNDCLNIDRLGSYWEKPSFRKQMEEGISYTEASRTNNKKDEERRQNNWPGEAQKLANTLKRMKKADQKVLSVAEGADRRHVLEVLQKQIELLLLQNPVVVQVDPNAKKSEKAA